MKTEPMTLDQLNAIREHHSHPWGSECSRAVLHDYLNQLIAEVDRLQELNTELIDKMNHVHQIAALASRGAHKLRSELDQLKEENEKLKKNTRDSSWKEDLCNGN